MMSSNPVLSAMIAARRHSRQYSGFDCSKSASDGSGGASGSSTVTSAVEVVAAAGAFALPLPLPGTWLRKSDISERNTQRKSLRLLDHGVVLVCCCCRGKEERLPETSIVHTFAREHSNGGSATPPSAATKTAEPTLESTFV